MTTRLLIPIAAAAAAVGGAFGIALHLAFGARSTKRDLPLPALHGQANWIAGARPAPGFRLVDQAGHIVSLRAQRGRPVVLAFMDPLCKNECPIEGRGISLAERQVAPAKRPVTLIVSVNPLARASDAVRAAHKWGITGDWHWLLGDRAQLAPVWKHYGITVIPSSHDIVHSTAVYLLDRRGDERAGFIAPFLPQFVADDLKVLGES